MRELKYTYPKGCDTPEARKAFRRDARKVARDEGTYVPYKANQALDAATRVERLRGQLAQAEHDAAVEAECAAFLEAEQKAADEAAAHLAARKAAFLEAAKAKAKA